MKQKPKTFGTGDGCVSGVKRLRVAAATSRRIRKRRRRLRFASRRFLPSSARFGGVSFRANATSARVPIAGPVPSESRAYRRLLHRRLDASRRTSSSPLVNGLSDRGVELSSLAPAEAWNELVLIFEASSRLLDPARGSRRSWGVRSDARRGTPSAFAVRAARVDRTAGGNADARRRVRRARRGQTQIYNRVEGHKTRAKRRLARWRDPIRGVFFRFCQTGRTTRSTPAEALRVQKADRKFSIVPTFRRGRCFR